MWHIFSISVSYVSSIKIWQKGPKHRKPVQFQVAPGLNNQLHVLLEIGVKVVELQLPLSFEKNLQRKEVISYSGLTLKVKNKTQSKKATHKQANRNHQKPACQGTIVSFVFPQCGKSANLGSGICLVNVVHHYVDKAVNFRRTLLWHLRAGSSGKQNPSKTDLSFRSGSFHLGCCWLDSLEFSHLHAASSGKHSHLFWCLCGIGTFVTVPSLWMRTESPLKC